MRALVLVIAGLTIGAGCSTNHIDPTGPLREGAASLDDTVTVTLGKSALTRDGAVRVSFLEKLPDSRCGIDVVCVWAGDVGAVLRIETLTHSGDGRVHTALDPRRFVLGDYEISLIDMVPYPGDRRNIQTAAAVRVLKTQSGLSR